MLIVTSDKSGHYSFMFSYILAEMLGIKQRFSMEVNMISILMLLLLSSGNDYMSPLRKSKVLVGALSIMRQSAKIPEDVSQRHRNGPTYQKRYQNGGIEVASSSLHSPSKSQRVESGKKRRTQFIKSFSGYAGNLDAKRTFDDSYNVPKSSSRDAKRKSLRQRLSHEKSYKKLAKDGINAGSSFGWARLHGKRVPGGLRTGFKKKLNGLHTIGPAEASRYLDKLFHDIGMHF